MGLPNDEAFVATNLVAGGFKCIDILDRFPAVYDSSTFSFSRPVSGRYFESIESDGKLYHPVLWGSAFLHKALYYCSRHGNWDKFAKEIARECSPQIAEIFKKAGR
jgi:hypothetical protein